MTTEHNSDNTTEVNRILSEHPPEEERDIIRGDRLLGILAPLRAFGDFKFKWPEETINQVCLLGLLSRHLGVKKFRILAIDRLLMYNYY